MRKSSTSFQSMPKITEESRETNEEEQDENKMIVEAKIPYANLEVLTDLGEGYFTWVLEQI